MWQVHEMWEFDEDRASRSRSTAHGSGDRRALASAGRSGAAIVVMQRSRSLDPLDSRVLSPFVPLPFVPLPFDLSPCVLSALVGSALVGRRGHVGSVRDGAVEGPCSRTGTQEGLDRRPRTLPA